MRSLVLVTGVLAFAAGLWLARGFHEHCQQQSVAARQIEAEIQDLARKKALLEKLPRQEPGTLMRAYAGFVNEIGMMARFHHVTWGAVVRGLNDADVQKSAMPSDISGVRELGLQVTFSNFPRFGTLLSLLDAVSDVGHVFPVVVRKVSFEKDSLVLDVSVLGP